MVDTPLLITRQNVNTCFLWSEDPKEWVHPVQVLNKLTFMTGNNTNSNNTLLYI